MDREIFIMTLAMVIFVNKLRFTSPLAKYDVYFYVILIFMRICCRDNYADVTTNIALANLWPPVDVTKKFPCFYCILCAKYAFQTILKL